MPQSKNVPFEVPANSTLTWLVGGISSSCAGVLQAEIGVNPRSLQPDKDLAGLFQQIIGKPLSQPVERPIAKTWMDALLQWGAAIQYIHKHPVFVDGIAWCAEPGGLNYTLLFPADDREAGRLALEWSIRTLNAIAAADSSSRGIDQLISECRNDADRVGRQLVSRATPSKGNMFLLYAAHKLGVPWRRVHGHTYRLGHGCHSRYLNSSVTDLTPAMGLELARNKQAAARMLRRAGIPVPDHAIAKDVDAAVRIAHDMGYPVVVKPADQDAGIGVSAGIETDEQLAAAFEIAQRVSRHILVEEHVSALEYRFGNRAGKVDNVIARYPGGVTGDGSSTIKDLVDRLNAERQRTWGIEKDAEPIEIDDEAYRMLGHQRLTLDSVPEQGQVVKLRSCVNVSRGGTVEEISLDDIHPDNIRLIERVLDLLRLDLADIDFITEDIARPWYEVRCAITDVNGQPSYNLYADNPTYTKVVKWLMQDTEGRIPTVLIVVDEENGPSPIGSELHQLLTKLLPCTGLANCEGAWVGGERVGRDNSRGLVGSERLMSCRQTDAAILEVTFSDICAQGLPVDRCNVLIMEISVIRDEPILSLLFDGASEAIIGPSAIVDMGSRAESEARHKFISIGDQPNEAPLSSCRTSDTKRAFFEGDIIVIEGAGERQEIPAKIFSSDLSLQLAYHFLTQDKG